MHNHQNTPQALIADLLLYRWPIRFCILALSFFSTLFGLAAPLFQKEFVDFISHQEQAPWLPALGSAPMALTAAFGCLLLSLALNAMATFLGSYESIKMQRRWSQRLYEKTLALRTDSLHGRSVGEIVSLYATDIPGATVFLEQSLPFGANILFPLILAPTAIILLFDLPVFPAVITIGSVVLLNGIMAFRQSVYFFYFKKLAADRIGYVNEWIQNIRLLRTLGWVQAFEQKIFEKREIETKNRVAMVTNGQAMNSINSSVTFFLNIFAVVGLIHYSGHPISHGDLLALLWIVAVFLTRPFRMMPWFFTFFFDSWTSLKRLSEFLSLENFSGLFENRNYSQENRRKAVSQEPLSLEVRNLNLVIRGKSILKNISFSAPAGKFITIVGEVGSGKTSLLLSLAGETGAHFENYLIGRRDAKMFSLAELKRHFAFVPQEGFIMSASLRENVAFEYDVDNSYDKNLEKSLSRSQFELAQEGIIGGLNTEIGERGVNLSGGQRQRISLARVDYYQSSIILLDDSLSAVDVNTENRLIENLISGAWKDRTRLMVTHRLTVLEKSDLILFLQNGELKEQGGFHELYSKSKDFREFVSTIQTKPQPEVLA